MDNIKRESNQNSIREQARRIHAHCLTGVQNMDPNDILEKITSSIFQKQSFYLFKQTRFTSVGWSFDKVETGALNCDRVDAIHSQSTGVWQNRKQP